MSEFAAPERTLADASESETRTPANGTSGRERQRGRGRPGASLSVGGEPIRFRLDLGAVDDPAEAEADRIADQVIRRINASPASRAAPTEAPNDQPSDAGPAPLLRRSASGSAGSARLDGDVERRVQRARSGGVSLPEPVRRSMEYGFGADLAAVRVHTGPEAADLNRRFDAQAFTVGDDVFFRDGMPDAATSDGSRLIAHELSHTFQQRGVQGRGVQRHGMRRSSTIRRKKDKTKPTGNFWTDLHQEIDEQGEELRQFAAKQFGVKGMPRFGVRGRSSEARKWRAALKAAAREQARADVDTAIDAMETDNGRNSKLLDTEKAFYRLKAKKLVYSQSKASVNEAVALAVDDVVLEMWTNQSLDIFQAAARAYMDHKQTHPDDFDGAQAIARGVLATALQKAKDDARDAKRVVFGKDNAPDVQSDDVAAAATTMDKTALEQRSKAMVTKNKVGAEAVRKTIEADSVEAGMGVLGKLLDHVVGSSGDQVSLQIEFKVPIDPSGVGYVSFTLTGKAARGIDGAMTAGVPVFGDPRRLEVMADFKFRLGADIATVLDIGANFSLFARGGANDTALCMKALSYGAYRRLGAVSDTAANWWSGADSGLRDTAEYRKDGIGGKAHYAESWAAMVEQQAFKEGGAFVDVGGGIGGSAKLSLGPDDMFGGLELEGGISAFHRYDDASLSESLGSAYATEVADKKAAKSRRDDVAGSAGASYAIAAKVVLNIPKGPTLELAGSLSGSLTDPHSFGIEITGTIGYNGDSSSGIERWAVGYATGVADLMKSLAKAGNACYNDRADAGAFTEAIAGTTQAIDAGLKNTITDSLASAWKVAEGPAEGAAGLVTSSSLQVALIIGTERYQEVEVKPDGTRVDKKRLKPIIRLEIRSGRKLEINTPMAGAAGVKITAEKTSRLAAVGINTGKDERPGKNEGARRLKLDTETLGVRGRGKTNQRGKKGR